VAAYLARIEENNHDGLFLRAVIETAPRDDVIQIAQFYDSQREKGIKHGLLHGVPILVKDNIATDPSLGMETTAGTFALGMIIDLRD
jgi:amidase